MSLIRNTKLLLPVTFAALLLSGCASAPSGIVSAPLPPDLQIVAPDASQPAAIRGLSGKWVAKWIGLAGGTQQETVLVVEKIDGSTATVVYAQGDNPRFPTLHRRPTAKVGPGQIDFSLTFRSSLDFKYELQADGTLKGTMLSNGFRTVATLHRVP